MNTSVKPMIIPPVDPSVNYPLSSSNISKTFLDNLIFIGSTCLILILFIISNIFPKFIKRFYLFTAIWYMISINCISLATSSYFKSFVGWPRPDTYAVCGFNSTFETCTSLKKREKQFLSWPSYHATQAMTGATFNALFLQKTLPKFIIFDLLELSMILYAIYVGATRIKDYKHHPEDVTAGFLIGFIIPVFLWNGAKKRIFSKKNIIENHPNLQEKHESSEILPIEVD